MDLTFITTGFVDNLASGTFMGMALMVWSFLLLGWFLGAEHMVMKDYESFIAETFPIEDEWFIEEEEDIEEEFYGALMSQLEADELEEWADSLDWDALEDLGWNRGGDGLDEDNWILMYNINNLLASEPELKDI